MSNHCLRTTYEKTGRWLPRKSTGETEKSKAVKKAFEWYAKGVPQKDCSQTVETLALRNTIRLGLGNLSRPEQEFLLAEMKRQGVIKSFVLSGGKSDVVLTSFLLEFWDFEKSEYVAERLENAQIEAFGGFVNRSAVISFNSKKLHDYVQTGWKKIIAETNISPPNIASKNSIISPPVRKGLLPSEYFVQYKAGDLLFFLVRHLVYPRALIARAEHRELLMRCSRRLPSGSRSRAAPSAVLALCLQISSYKYTIILIFIKFFI